MCPAEVFTLIDREREAFEKLYPQARVTIRKGTSGEAIRALFEAKCDLATLTRELEPEERGAAARGGLEVEGYRFARDALVVTVHPSNPVENIAVDDLRRIYMGETTSWREVGGPDLGIEPVVQPLESDFMEFFMQQVMDQQPIRAPVVVADSDSEVVAEISRRPRSVGFVSVGWADRAPKALRLAGLVGLSYYKPDPEAIYRGEYPLTRFVSLYARQDGARLANGFVTFVTSRQGQEIVYQSGLVPTSVPVRFVRRSPLQGSH